MIKYLLFPICTTMSLFGAYSSAPQPVTGSTGQSKMHQMQQKHPDTLPEDQRHVMNMLSPLYQKIYMYGLNDDQREAVAVFERRGENPYQAIDNILKRDRMRSDPLMNQDKSPRGRTERSTSQKSYILSEKSNDQMDEVNDNNDEDYELYTSEAPVKESVTCSRYKSYKPVEKKKPENAVVKETPKPKYPKESCSPCNDKKSIEVVKKTPKPKCPKESCSTCKSKKSLKVVKKPVVKKTAKPKACHKKTQKKYRYVENYSRCKCKSCTK